MAIEFITRIGPGFTAKPTFEAMTFPAGEAHIKVVNEQNLGARAEIAYVTGYSADDLMKLAMWADAVRQRGDRAVLLMPYLPGARADRGIPFGANVYAQLINSMQLDQAVCFDPHSPVMPSLINNLTVIDSVALVRNHVVGRADSDEKPQRYTGIIAPDAGAAERAGRVAEACHLPLYQARKKRNPDTGKLSGFTCDELPADGRYLIVDDICDGGGTFMGLAEVTGLPKEQLGLYVSHGVFSKRAFQLNEHFGEVFTTDSFAAAAPAASGTPDEQPRITYTTIPLRSTLLGAVS